MRTYSREDNVLYIIMLLTMMVIGLWVYKFIFWVLVKLWHLF